LKPGGQPTGHRAKELNRQDAKEHSKAQNTKRNNRPGELMRVLDLQFLNVFWRLGGLIFLIVLFLAAKLTL